MTLVKGSSNDGFGDGVVDAVALPGLEGLFYAAVFAGVKREDSDTTAWI